MDQHLNNSKILVGFALILINVGSKYISYDLPKTLDNIFKHSLLRKIVVFSIVFISTRDIKISLLITLLYILLFSILLHEDSDLCILPEQYLNFKKDFDLNDDGKISKDEIETIKKIIKQYKTNVINPLN